MIGGWLIGFILRVLAYISPQYSELGYDVGSLSIPDVPEDVPIEAPLEGEEPDHDASDPARAGDRSEVVLHVQHNSIEFGAPDPPSEMIGG